MNNELEQFRVWIAGDMVECPKHDDEHSWKDGVCLRCSIDGETSPGRVYRFGGALREPCPCIASGGLVCRMCADVPTASTVIHGENCLNCQGRGWVPAENFFALLLVELWEAGLAYRIEPDYVAVWEWGHPTRRDDKGDDLEARLYRAVCAVLEAAP